MKPIEHTILLAHGSRDPRWTKPFQAITSRVKQRDNEVSLAYMELVSPDLHEAVSQAHHQGANKIFVIPLFFAAGKHLRDDVPGILHDLSLHFDVEIKLLPPIGEHTDFQTAIVETISALLNSGDKTT